MTLLERALRCHVSQTVQRTRLEVMKELQTHYGIARNAARCYFVLQDRAFTRTEQDIHDMLEAFPGDYTPQWYPYITITYGAQGYGPPEEA